MERLKRVFNIDLELCEACGKRGHVKVTACIDDPVIIKKILTHLKQQEQTGPSVNPQQSLFPEDRGPPELDSGRGLFD